ncbi:endolytic murein transglycosylase [Comamonadaceae bacterium OS-4]|nr:endolytic murein transglycosylase [Comamonadaceae bacterium OS-4]
MRFFIAVVLAVVALVASGFVWVQSPLKLEATVVDIHIDAGSSAREVAHQVAGSGVHVSEDLLYAWFRLSGKSRQIRAGSYELNAGITPKTLLEKFVRGDQALRSVTILEGWTFRQARQALAKADALKQDSRGLSDDAIMAALGRAGQHPEGRFFPDTYTYAKGSSDMDVLGQALKAMDKQLEAAWSIRRANQRLQTPEQALILASIIEKETGKTADQALISSVFHNRMQIGMRLQTDPTVIYGLGERFDGNLRRSDLLADTPYNTYTRNGLPPTPISLPGKSALIAAIQPVSSKALYFVARGDGGSYFSESLDEHNRAVDKYQRGR